MVIPNLREEGLHMAQMLKHLTLGMPVCTSIAEMLKGRYMG